MKVSGLSSQFCGVSSSTSGLIQLEGSAHEFHLTNFSFKDFSGLGIYAIINSANTPPKIAHGTFDGNNAAGTGAALYVYNTTNGVFDDTELLS
jgi:hypothetical protein